MRILILNGPNLNLLGQRENEIYGSQTLGDLESQLRKLGQSQGVDIECYQSNYEGHLIDALHRARNRVQGVVFNPGGYCHTSVALRDAITAIRIPVVEVHISNIYAREEFRHRSLTAGACVGQVSGFGFMSYELALQAVVRHLRAQQPGAEPVRQTERFSDRGERRDERREERRPEDRREPAREERREPPREERREPVREPVREERTEDQREREEREDREGKRRRRGRRGGRGRRRDQDEAPRGEEREGIESPEHEAIDIAERYSNLKGVVVRRGLDVLAEIGEEGEEEPPAPHAQGLVTFRDASEDVQEAYAANRPEPNEPALAVTPTAPSARPAPPKEPAPEPRRPAPEPEPEPEAVEEAAAEPAAEPEPPAEGEGEAEGESHAGEEGGEAAKTSRGRRRKPATGGGRRRAPARKKTSE